MAKVLFTNHDRKNTQIELNVIAELRSVSELSDIDPVIWTFNNLKQSYNVKNGMLLGHIYDLERQDSFTAVLWHKDIKGDRDRKVITIQVQSHE